MIQSHTTTDIALAEAERSVTAPFTRLLAANRPVVVPVAVLVFAALTAVGGQVAVPLGFTPVPMTLQTLFVLLAGVLLGPVAGAASQLLYLGLGLAGVPVFAMGGAGLPWLLSPTGGYLLAFPAAAALAGWIAGRERHRVRTAVALVVATALIFASGAGWLSVVTGLGGREVFASGVQPFLPGAVIKAAIVYVVARWAFSRRVPQNGDPRT
ncbi:MAG: biotin transporter BioY [Gemmatimonadetes bacterium]|nr:biotin transporter BioY [Gemmatimonadota bacterium]MYA63637.1 biotin transporter BioY [Gemmatimonadota bacterium]MYB97313.1 biotin transporter BioY [Gemmatimonadota bacterium]MYH53018.1 biotin transporter BioY [Gemmatimonadota bacterium]MYI45609.1 biotin transporter BioY [Gemmatimonadota bacterium]